MGFFKLDTMDGYHVDWKQKLIDEPGRWNEQIDDLWRQLGDTEKGQETMKAYAG